MLNLSLSIIMSLSTPSSRSLPSLLFLARHASFSSSSTPAPDFSRLPGARTPKVAAEKGPRPLRVPSHDAARSALSHCVELVKKHDKASYLGEKFTPYLLCFIRLQLNMSYFRLGDIDPFWYSKIVSNYP